MVAESPFVVYCEREQDFCRRHFRRLLWKMLKIAHASGQLGNFAWSDIERQIEIKIDVPIVSSRDPDKETGRRKILSDEGILSAKTWASEEGYDYEAEQALGAEKVQPPGLLPSGAGGGSQKKGNSNPLDGDNDGIFPESRLAVAWGKIWGDYAGGQPLLEQQNCGTGKGGFQLGNKCAADTGGGSGGGRSAKKNSKQTEPEIGPHGPIFREFYHDEIGAVKKLKELKAGEAIAALHHKKLGDIDLVWGDAGDERGGGYGLAHILDKHPEMESHLQSSLNEAWIHKNEKEYVTLRTKKHQIVLRLDWEGERKRWLVSAFKRN